MRYVALMLMVGFVIPAQASDRNINFRWQAVPATVPGIHSVPVAGYGPVRRIVRSPTADIFSLSDPAPANGCEGTRGGFRIESGTDAGACTGR